jgi:hypothetical protein
VHHRARLDLLDRLFKDADQTPGEFIQDRETECSIHTPAKTKQETDMATIILSYKLKDGVTQADFENWVKTVDHPAMRGLASVSRFETYRVTGLLMGEGQPSTSYIEVFELNDFAAFTGTDMPGDTVQGVMGQFMGFAETPEFMVAEAVDPS